MVTYLFYIGKFVPLDLLEWSLLHEQTLSEFSQAILDLPLLLIDPTWLLEAFEFVFPGFCGAF